MMNRVQFPARMSTSQLITLSLIPVALAVFSLITVGLYSQLSQYIATRVNQYVGAVVNQIEERLNNALYGIDSSIQRLCNDDQTQALLNGAYKTQGALTNEGIRLLRSKILEAQLYAEEIQDIEIYGIEHNLYPGTKTSIVEKIPPELLQQVDHRNGAVVWYGDEGSPNRIIGIKRILLSDYEFISAGYLIVTLEPNFLRFLQHDFNRIEGGAILLSDSTGQIIGQYESDAFLSAQNTRLQEYDVVTTQSNYTNWMITIYTPHLLLEGDVVWLNRVLLVTFSIGFLLLLCGGLAIARFITLPIRDMEQFMRRPSWPLDSNEKHYFNADVDMLNRRFNQLVERSNDLSKARINEEHLRAKAELKALEAQVNPHFIINALESIYWSLVGNGEEENAEMALSLARLFRYILKAQDWLSLREEIDFVRQYMKIEQFRFSDRLLFAIKVDESLMDTQIPKLLIQPLVENAVKHGVEASAEAVTVQVEVRREEQQIVISISDDGAGISPDAMKTIEESFQDDMPVGSVSAGFGLVNLKKRLQIYYGDKAHLGLKSKQQGTDVTIRIPLS